MDNFFTDLYKRFITKSPKFFRIIQVLALIAASIAEIPAFLTESGIELPGVLPEPYKTIVTIASITAIIIARLPNETTSTTPVPPPVV